MSLSSQRWQAAQQCLSRDDAAGARVHLLALVRAEPSHTYAHLYLGGIAYAGGDLRSAAQHALDAARTRPEQAVVIAHVVNALVLAGEMTAARACLALPGVAACQDGVLLTGFASAQQTLGEHAPALALLERAIEVGPPNPDMPYLHGVQLMFNGRLEAAAAEFATCLRQGPQNGRAAVALARLRKQSRESNHLPQIDTCLARVEQGSEDHAAFEFARYKELDDIGEIDEAWVALERGNSLMSKRLPVDVPGDSTLVDALIARCSGEFLRPTDVIHTGPQPIFIVGMPRSGTTVLERLLGNHSQVTSAGELGDFPRQLRWAANLVTTHLLDPAIVERAATFDYAEIGRRYLAQTQWRAAGRPWFVDKLPINHLNVAFIQRALPQARILHMTRDPMDVCFSNYRAYFGEGYAYSYRFDALAAYYANYRRVMNHWHREMPGRVLDISYASLVSDPEAAARIVLDFCQLPFEPGVADLRRNTAPSATLSTMQVREGIHQRARGEWTRYAARLAPLQRKLHDAGIL